MSLLGKLTRAVCTRRSFHLPVAPLNTYVQTSIVSYLTARASCNVVVASYQQFTRIRSLRSEEKVRLSPREKGSCVYLT